MPNVENFCRAEAKAKLLNVRRYIFLLLLCRFAVTARLGCATNIMHCQGLVGVCVSNNDVRLHLICTARTFACRSCCHSHTHALVSHAHIGTQSAISMQYANPDGFRPAGLTYTHSLGNLCTQKKTLKIIIIKIEFGWKPILFIVHKGFFFTLLLLSLTSQE